MSEKTDLNISPYYDDYDSSKNYHKVLFRAGRPLQARELTQSQSILQDQVAKFGDHMFKQGAMVIPGQVSIDTNYESVKLTSKSAGDNGFKSDEPFTVLNCPSLVKNILSILFK